ncbi:MAG: VWA domain-containing protein, partial [Planctomycetes bacterium]|nr:VWA domain-containing protein [Planctomycetota bacterium]
MNLLYPELLLLAFPLAIALWKSSPGWSTRLLLRALIAISLLLAIAGPHGGGSVSGRDLVLVIDRSRSMPGGSQATVAEVMKLAGEQMKTGDRISVLTFAADHAIEQAPSNSASLDGYSTTLDADGSNLTSALEQALALIPENRPGSILLFSDGEFHGTPPDAVARRAAMRDIHIDVRSARISSNVDVAVESIDLPSSVEVGEPFQFAAYVRSDRETTAQYTLLRGETVIGRGSQELRSGLNQLLFRDLGQSAGLAKYRLKLELDGDRVLANNVGLGVMRVEGNRPILLINQDGAQGRLAAALLGAGMKVQVVTPKQLPKHDASWLENFRSIVLENLPATALGSMLPAIASQVRDLGTGLLITGGQASFGVGGYYRSSLDPLLPVTMEMRVEHRKAGLALAFVLDRSGSMGASVAGGLTKMDLANAGTMEAIHLLGPMDEVTVIAVDSEPHMIVPLTPVNDPEAFTSRVSGINSGGGGIYTYTGLSAATLELSKTARSNRHIVLFADAADAEEPGRYVELLNDLTTKYNTTVSVVALGDPSNSDAVFLQDVARRGGGQIFFSQDPAELQRLFAQDTLLAARSSFIDLATTTES